MGLAPRVLVVCALFALGGCGTTTSKPTTRPDNRPAQVRLVLLGGGAAPRLSACGFTERYKMYRFGGFVRYTGRVSPAPTGPWQVKVKLKRCISHGYSESFFELVRGRADGSFAGLVPTLNPNTFYVRADYKGPTGTVRSPLAFFRVVGHG